MSIRSLASLSALAFAVAAIQPMPSAAQATQQRWTSSLTPDGQPDLQGNWVNKNATPLQRPKQLEGREFLTDAEVAELKRGPARLFEKGHSDFPAGGAFFLAAWATREPDKRASSPAASRHERKRLRQRP